MGSTRFDEYGNGKKLTQWQDNVINVVFGSACSSFLSLIEAVPSMYLLAANHLNGRM